MDKQWELGEELLACENLLDSLTFDDLITAAQCNGRAINEESVRAEFQAMFESRLEDMRFFLDNNMKEILKIVRERREN